MAIMNPDLSLNLCGIDMANPVVTCSGTSGNGRELARFLDLDALGAFTAKSITIDKRPIPCKWHLTVVSSSDGGRTVGARLSDAILVETTIDETIIVANWRKNW